MNPVMQRARDWLSFASPREPGWALIRDLAAEIDNLTLQNEACGNALVDSEAVNQRLREALERIANPWMAKTAVLRELAREALAGDGE